MNMRLNMTPSKKIPVRMCAGCRERKPKNEMLRIVRKPDGEVMIDRTGKTSGRGTYLCRNQECLKKAEKSGSIRKVLEISIPADLYRRLESELQNEE